MGPIRLLCSLIMLVITSATWADSVPHSDMFRMEPDDVVWHWFSECGDGITLQLNITHKNSVIFEKSFTACQMLRKDIPHEVEQRILRFEMRSPTQSLFGEPKGRKLHGEVWEAGNYETELILMVSIDYGGKAPYSVQVGVRPGESIRFETARTLWIELSTVP